VVALTPRWITLVRTTGCGHHTVLAKHADWGQNELLVAFRLYCHTDFGRIHQRNPEIIEPEAPQGPTEVERLARVRRIQGFFRATVLTSYENRCAVSGMAIPELLVPSHIIPWSIQPERRGDPRNGIALNALHDRAFDRGLIAFEESWRLVISQRLWNGDFPLFQREAFLEIEGQLTLRGYLGFHDGSSNRARTHAIAQLASQHINVLLNSPK
jgi:hypothetical protein